MDAIQRRDAIRLACKNHLTEYVESITRKLKPTDEKYICPLCGSGTHENGTPAFSINKKDPTQWKCFSCEAHGDILDLIGLHEGITSHNKQLERACKYFGIDYDCSQLDEEAVKETGADNIAEPNTTKEEFSAYFDRVQAHIRETDYLTRRGISLATAYSFDIGYDSQWRSSKAPETVPTSPRLIFPYGDGGYMARDTRLDVPPNQQAYIKQKEGKTGFFNASALKLRSPVYVVEGEMDVLSIAEVGGLAVSLGGTSNVEAFVEHCLKQQEDGPTLPTLLISLDNDDAGRKAQERLCVSLTAHNLPFLCYDVAGGAKDANDALLRDREAFTNAVREGVQLPFKIAVDKFKQRCSISGRMLAFTDGIAYRRTNPPIETGFPAVDDLLEGGLSKGLYVLGAESGLGKSTFALQMADSIAQGGHSVYVVSLEMAADELIAKSISRNMAKRARANGIDIDLCADRLEHKVPVEEVKTVAGILQGKRYDSYSDPEKQLIQMAIDDCRAYGNNIFIAERGSEGVTMNDVRKGLSAYIQATQEIPVLIIDYLQMLKPMVEGQTDKQAVDSNVIALIGLRDQYKIPIIAISSFNRSGYKKEAEKSSFKESGLIEYSADILLGLNQLTGSTRSKRSIALNVLKNRLGRAGKDVNAYFNFYPALNWFVPTTGALDWDDTVI